MKIPQLEQPRSGQRIPRGWHQRLYKFLQSLVVRGDGRTVRVTQTPTGQVITAIPNPDGVPFPATNKPIIAEITSNNGGGSYDAKQQRNDAGTWEDHANTPLQFDSGNNGNLYELNAMDGIPVGSIVIVHKMIDVNGDPVWYFDAACDRYGFGTRGGGAWVEITAEGTGGNAGKYSWKQLDPDASTDASPAVTGSLNLYEVEGRQGIKVGSIVWARFDGTNYQTTYHHAPDGTKQALTDGVIGTPGSDTWDRSDQGTKFGFSLAGVVTNLLVDASTGEIYQERRPHTGEANGHAQTWGTKSQSLIGVGTPSTETYPYLACSDGTTVVARYAFADLPPSLAHWIYDGAEFVKASRGTIGVGAATNPAPCYLGGGDECADLSPSDFDDDFNGTNGDPLDDCLWTRISSDGTAEIQSNKLEISIAENTTGSDDGEEKWENAYNFTGDFDVQVTIDSTGLDVTTAAGEFLRADLQLVGAGSLFRALTIGAWPSDSGFLPNDFGYDFQQDGSPSSNNGASYSAGSYVFRFVRVGTALTGYIDGNSFSFNSTSGDLQLRIRVIATGSSNPAVSATFENLTINSAD